MRMSIITLATDFGTVDGYAAAMKGVMKKLAPKAELIDITHELGSIAKASIVLRRYYSFYPANAIHLVVVDPTVGSKRKAMVGTADKYRFVGPDNGIFSRVIEDNPGSRWWQIDPEKLPTKEISPTFHGRDLFAPAAAVLANGLSVERLGDEIKEPVLIDIPKPTTTASNIEGEIIDVDRFGNLITNIESGLAGKNAEIVLNDCHPLKMAMTFSDVPAGQPLAYAGSLGYLEIGVNLGRADSFFGASVGSRVKVKR